MCKRCGKHLLSRILGLGSAWHRSRLIENFGFLSYGKLNRIHVRRHRRLNTGITGETEHAQRGIRVLRIARHIRSGWTDTPTRYHANVFMRTRRKKPATWPAEDLAVGRLNRTTCRRLHRRIWTGWPSSFQTWNTCCSHQGRNCRTWSIRSPWGRSVLLNWWRSVDARDWVFKPGACVPCGRECFDWHRHLHTP